MDYNDFYSALFRELELKYGPLDAETITSIIGFSAGGPVSLATQDSNKIFVSCELAVYPEQNLSCEDLNFEFLSVGDFSEDWCRSVFTALGALSMEAVLGDNHTIDISGIIEPDEPVKQVKLKLFSRTTYSGKEYGLYQVVPG